MKNIEATRSIDNHWMISSTDFLIDISNGNLVSHINEGFSNSLILEVTLW